ncbi:hypothetical protein, partial [Mycobacterium marinum]|uniref:hypothetical protein n=2 Tax=Mycobacterium marinum TaxID=1781 RepID=UPI0035695925
TRVTGAAITTYTAGAADTGGAHGTTTTLAGRTSSAGGTTNTADTSGTPDPLIAHRATPVATWTAESSVAALAAGA